MPKIRDLGISAIPFARSPDESHDAAGYWMCDQTLTCSSPCDPSAPQCHPSPPPCQASQCQPSPPECQPSPPECQPTNGGQKKNARGLPHAAVLQLKQQLQERIGRQFHA